MIRTIRSLAIPIAIVLAAESPARAQPACGAATAARLRLDHVPIAVRDLDAAKRDFAALGFSFKPGRPHENSIDNQHVKFANGSALELITVREPRDDLARHYLAFLARGEGGAFLSLDAGPVDSLSAAIRALEPAHRTSVGSYYQNLGFPGAHPLRYLFFIVIRSRPPDLPEHLVHANTAARLSAVWLRRPGLSRERRMLERLGARACPSALRLPAGDVGAELRLERGSLYLIDAPGAPADRPIAGLTVEVADLDAARRAVSLPDSVLRRGRDARGEWLRIPPGHARGVWLELLRPAGAQPAAGAEPSPKKAP
jgi:hypothetical protein